MVLGFGQEVIENIGLTCETAIDTIGANVIKLFTVVIYEFS
jgi:hypothetical protein